MSIVLLSGSLCTLSARAGQHVLPAGADSGGVAQKGTNSSLRSRRRGRTGKAMALLLFHIVSCLPRPHPGHKLFGAKEADSL